MRHHCIDTKVQKFIIFNIILFSMLSGYNQTKRGIFLENKKNHNKSFLKEGRNVKIVCRDGKILNGRFHIQNGWDKVLLFLLATVSVL